MNTYIFFYGNGYEYQSKIKLHSFIFAILCIISAHK